MVDMITDEVEGNAIVIYVLVAGRTSEKRHLRLGFGVCCLRMVVILGGDWDSGREGIEERKFLKTK